MAGILAREVSASSPPSQAMRVVIHSNRAADLLPRLLETHADVHVECVDDFASLPTVLRTFKPSVIYSTRFDVSQDYPRDAVMEQSGVQWVSVGGSGVDHLGLWDPQGIVVTNSAGVAAQMMAEYVFGAFRTFLSIFRD